MALPNYSSYREVLPPNGYLRWTERTDTAADIARLTDRTLVAPLAHYLTIRHDAEATARLLAQVLTMPSPVLRSGALAALESRRELAPLLDTGALEPLGPYLRNDRMAPAERGAVLVRLARIGARGIVPIAEEIAGGGGPLLAPAVDALVTLGKPPAEKQLLTYSRNDDAALRLAAARGLGGYGSPGALDRLAAMLATDSSNDVRLAVIGALGGVPSARAVDLLAGSLGGNDKGQINAAADALARQASPQAIEALGEALRRGSQEAQAAAVFGLQRSGKPDALQLLREQQHAHPDPQVRKLITIALGGAPEEHE
jgi:HEAT repeat protein